MKKYIISFILVVGLCLLWSSIKRDQNPIRIDTQSVSVECAAGMQKPMEEIRKAYEAEYGVVIKPNYGGSGKLLGALKIVSRADIYIAADVSYIELAIEAGLIDEQFTLATMSPVIAVAKGNPKGITTILDLTKPNIRYALADPEVTAIGKITKQILVKHQLWETILKGVKVTKPTVNDLANDVTLGTVDAAIIWDAVAVQFGNMDIIRPPEFIGQSKAVSLGILKSSANPTAALRFARYLSAKDKGLPIFKKHGFQIVEGDKWAKVPEVDLYSGGVNRLAIEKSLDEFRAREGVVIHTNFNGCGFLVGQMKGGTIPEAYFACDVTFATEVKDVFDKRVDLATTDIVIVTQKGNPMGIHSLEDLKQSGLRLGMANPELTALGNLTLNILKARNLDRQIMANIKSTTPTADSLLTQMRSGGIDAAFVYEANIGGVKDKVDIIEINDPKARAIQPYMVKKNGDHKQLMYRLLNKIRSDKSQTRFIDRGFNWLADPLPNNK